MSTPTPTKQDIIRQYELALTTTPDDTDELDASYIHSSFCLSSLPIRPRYLKDTQGKADNLPAVGRRREEHFYSRSVGPCSLNINGISLTLPQTNREVHIGVPWGARSRLLVLWVATAAQNQAQASQSSDSRWLSIGSIRSWFQAVGVPYHNESVNAIKEQLIRLSFARFTMVMKQNGLAFFNDEKLFDAKVFEDQDLEHYADNNMSNVRMPVGLKLSETAYNQFTGVNSIAIPTQSLRLISNNSMAIDIFLYMMYRLRSIPEKESLLITYKTLSTQFASGESKGRFLQAFGPSIERAIECLSCAKVDMTEEGLLIHHAPPLEFRKMFAITSPVAKPTSRARMINRIVPAQPQLTVKQPQLEL